MALTLRDAQHLCWKTFKKFEKIDQKNMIETTNGEKLIKNSEEIAQKIQKLQNSDLQSKKQEFSKLLSELIFSAFVLAEQQGVDLEESFLQEIDEMILGFIT